MQKHWSKKLGESLIDGLRVSLDAGEFEDYMTYLAVFLGEIQEQYSGNDTILYESSDSELRVEVKPLTIQEFKERYEDLSDDPSDPFNKISTEVH